MDSIKSDHYCKQVERIDRLVEEGSIRARQLDLLVEKIAGELEIDEYTGEPTGHRINGIADRVERLERQGNGGGGFSLRTKDKAQITAFFGIVVIIVNVIKEIW